MTMMSLSARRARLARPTLTSHVYFRASISMRRPFSSSIAQRNHETLGKDEKLPASVHGERNDILNSARMVRNSLDSLANTPEGINAAENMTDKKKTPQKSRRESGLKSLTARKGFSKEPKRSRDGDGSGRLIFGQSPELPIRTRFAPSPTGDLHLGSLRTALVNNLAASASSQGEFIIRIEDTDQKRLVPGAEERVFKDLKWAGLEWTEGPDKGGPYGPYRQSDRLPIYQEHTKKLLENGSAYRCFCTKETLEAQMKVDLEAGRSTVYPGTCRTIPPEESDQRAMSGDAYTVRMDSQKFGRPRFVDSVYGEFQKKNPEEDFVLMKTDGYPTYHLANVVDDHLMKITHVIRGEEWLISTPKHLALYKAFGWDSPTFAHLPLLVEEDGSKLSKRNASVNLDTYKQQNILPLAMQAWLANLGSSFYSKAPVPRTLQEVSDALTFKFTRGGVKLNPEKLFYFQNAYRQKLFATPRDQRTKAEHELIDRLIVAPLIEEVNSLTSSPSSSPIHISHAALPWIGPLELVDSMQPKAHKLRSRYAFKVLMNEKSAFKTLRDLVKSLPYLFWKPPQVVYRYSLARYPINRAIFDTVKELINCRPEDWENVRANQKWETISKTEAIALHGLVRLILVGDPEAQSRNTGVMFKVLGQEECCRRLRVVEELLKELDAGGKETQQKWLEEGRAAEAASEANGEVVV